MNCHRNRILNLSGFIVCLMLLSIAWYMQYVQGMRPCPLCMLQRLVFMGLALVLLLASIHNPKKIGSRIYALLTLLLALLGIFLASRHIWLQLHPPTTEAEICTPGFNYLITRLPFAEVIDFLWRSSENCSNIVKVLGVSIPVWSLLGFVAFGILAVVQLIWRNYPTKPAAPPHH